MAEETTFNSVGTMNASDVISAKLATCYVIANNKRKLLFQAKNLKAEVKKKKDQVAILGRMLKGNKTTSLEGTGTLTIYKNTSLFDEMIEKLIKTGVDTYFDMQVTNLDPTSNAGPRSVILVGCNLDVTPVADFDADGKWLEDELAFTFESVRYVTHFKELDGMNA